MARRRHTGIIETNLPYAATEPFLVSQLHFMAKAEACEMRALDTMRRVSKVRETRQFPERQAGDSLFVKIDSLKRPITYPQSREDHRPEREEFLARDLRKEARTEARKLAREEMRKDARKKVRETMHLKTRLLLDIHRQFQTLEIFHLNWRDLDDAREWIAEDNHRILTEKLGAGNPHVERILSEYRQSFFAPEIREALERYEMRWADQEKSLVTKEQAQSESDPVLKRELLDYLGSVPDDGGPDRKRIEAIKEIEYRYRQALDLLVKIVELDKNISIRPFEHAARIGKRTIKRLEGGRNAWSRQQAKPKRDALAVVKGIQDRPANKGKPLSAILRSARDAFKKQPPDVDRPDWPSEKTIYRWLLDPKKRRTPPKENQK